MTKRFLFILFALFLCLTSSSCVTFSAKNLSYIPQEEGKIISHFKTRVLLHGFVGTCAGGNLFDPHSKNTNKTLDEVLRDEIQKAGGDACINVSITYERKLWQSLVAKFTNTIWVMAYLTVEGDIISTQPREDLME